MHPIPRLFMSFTNKFGNEVVAPSAAIAGNLQVDGTAVIADIVITTASADTMTVQTLTAELALRAFELSPTLPTAPGEAGTSLTMYGTGAVASAAGGGSMGGPVSLTGGVGGFSPDAAGGAGGGATFAAGLGGAGVTNGGVGGSVTISSGSGGNGATAGAAGNFQVSGGNGGSGTTPGLGGSIILAAGAAGSGAGNANGGNVQLTPGAQTNAGVIGSIRLNGPTRSPVAAAQALLVSSTITLPTSGVNKLLSCGTPVNNIVMTVGRFDGEWVNLINTSAANSITFNAAGSNVADGASAVIAANRAMTLIWSATQSLWYRT